MRVRMYPHPSEIENTSSGIAQVVINYARHLPQYGVELVEPGDTTYDLDAAHAGGFAGAMVNHCHGLLWTAERQYSDSGYQINANLVRSFKLAREITVPSEWVAKTFWRDMRFKPHIVPHGVNWDEWQHDRPNEGYVLWGKNRTSDGLDPSTINEIAKAFPNTEFVTTFAASGAPDNVKVLGHAIPHDQMKVLIQSAAVLLAPDKETWGIMHAEAMASGVPVLTGDIGAVPSFMPHGVAGYCFQHTNLQDAINGLAYCLEHRDQLGQNGRELAREISWEYACQMVASIYELALKVEPPTVGIVIPCYNYGQYLDQAISSAVNQSYTIDQIAIVDDGSTDGSLSVAQSWAQRYGHIQVIEQENQGVAEARNAGLFALETKYVVFLDADDEIEPGFVELLLPYLEQQPNAGIAYTGTRVPLVDGTEILPWDWQYQPARHQLISQRIWPTHYDFAQQMDRSNQVPSCCLLRRKSLLRVYGYRSRYCPLGAGSEDADMFLRLGAYGWAGVYVPSTYNALWVHRHGEGNVSGREGYDEPDWTSWHPWTKNGKHPFASIANPANGISHPVHSFDQPLVSVVIPVGTGHEKELINALDSLEAQTFRGWEAIVVWDSQNRLDHRLVEAYPYVNWQVLAPGGKGTGAARNLGASLANGPLLAFLDADDYYHANFLQRCVDTFLNNNAVIYTDYVSILPKGTGRQSGMELIKEKEDGSLLVRGKFGDFNSDLAFERPSGDRPYVWSGVTVVVPKAWHDDVGGFDEKMPTWEDCEYLLKLAWTGCPFYRIPEELWIYDFTSGVRRSKSEGNEPNIIRYLQEKYDRIVLQEKMDQPINVQLQQ